MFPSILSLLCHQRKKYLLLEGKLKLLQENQTSFFCFPQLRYISHMRIAEELLSTSVLGTLLMLKQKLWFCS